MSAPALPWAKPVEYPVLGRPLPEERNAPGAGVLDVLGPLTEALGRVRALFDEVVTDAADQHVSMADLAVVVEQANLLERSASAVVIAATAGYARREQHDDVAEIGSGVESVRARGFVHEWTAQEVGHLVRVSARTADTRVTFAADVASVMPRSLAAVNAGAIEAWQAQTVLAFLREAGADDETIREIDAYLADRLAATDPSRLRALTRYALGRIRPDLLPDRARKARERRLLDKWEIEPGLTEITARMPSEKAAALWSAAPTLARDYLRDDPALTMDQARLDAFVDLALANVTVRTSVTLGLPVVTSAYARTGEAPVEPRDPQAPPPGDPEASWSSHAEASQPEDSVDTGSGAADGGRRSGGDPHEGQVSQDGSWAAPWRVPEWAAHPASSSGDLRPPPWCGADERRWWASGVHLPGFGYVPPDVVQSLITSFGTTMSTALLDSERGTVLAYVHRAYRPPTALAELVRLRDGRCRFYGCTMPAVRCDLDHAVAWEPESESAGGGQTSGDNLAALCRRHHRAKQQRQWTFFLDPDTSAAWWTNTVTGAWRTTVTAVATGCEEPPFVSRWTSRPVDHADDRAQVNRILAVVLGETPRQRATPPDGDMRSEPDPTAGGGEARVGCPPPSTSGELHNRAAIVAEARRPITDPTAAPPF